MKVLLLLAGRSRRFWPLSEKSLFPLCGKPLLGHQIARLKEAGLTDILLVCGTHNAEEVRRLFPDLQMVIQERPELGMQGAFLSALPHCGDEPVMVVSANDVVEPEAYRTVALAAALPGVDGALLAQQVTCYFPGGYLQVADGRIHSIVEKPGEGNEPSDLVNIVVHVHRHASLLLEELKQVNHQNDDGYEQAMDNLFHTHHYIPVPYTGAWQAVKFSWHLLHLLPILLQDVRSSIHPSAQIHCTAVIEGHVILGEGARVMPFARIVGPAVIGNGTIIGDGALVRRSSIGNHCVIGYNTEVKGCVLADHVWTHSTYLGDSVVGENTSFGAGCVTGNLRLDEGEIETTWDQGTQKSGLTKFGCIIGSGCRLGIQTGINPGLKIGSGVFVASQTMIDQDIPSDQFVRMKEGKLTVCKNRTRAPEPAAREHYRGVAFKR